MEFDELLQIIGEFGRAQKKYVSLLYLLYIYSGLHFLQLVFTGSEPRFWCQNGDAFPNATREFLENVTDHRVTILGWNARVCRAIDGEIDKCNVTYDDPHTSIVTEWNLVCDKTWQVSLTTSLFMTGVFLGSWSTGALSDKLGRKKSLFLCVVAGVVLSTASSFAYNLSMFAGLRVACGACFAGVQLITFVLVTELVGSKPRAPCVTVFESALAVSTILLCGLAYLILDWHLLTLVASLVGLALIPVFYYVPESPRWLIAHNKVEKAELILRNIAEKNDRLYPEGVELRDPGHSESMYHDPKNKTSMLWRHPKLRYRVLILMYSWFAVLGTYYGLSMLAADLSSNIYLNEFLLCIVELPGLMIATFSMNKAGRKKTMMASLGTAGAACAMIFVVPLIAGENVAIEVPTMKIALALFGKMSVTVSMACIFVHTSELLPTVLRNGGLGICTSAGRIGSIAAPFLSKLGEFLGDNPTSSVLEYIIYGCMAGTAACLYVFLPETLNKPMPDSIRDALLTESVPVLPKRRGLSRHHGHPQPRYGSVN